MKYRTIVIDPPWPLKFGQDTNRHLRPSVSSYKGTWRSEANRDYQVMKIKDIANLPLQALADQDCHLYIWTVNRYIPESYQLAKQSGFSPSTLLTWVKTPRGMGLGGTFVQTTEHVLYCRRGTPKTKKRIDTTWWNWKRPEKVTGPKHSRKPEEL